jgi:hypothetical protein
MQPSLEPLRKLLSGYRQKLVESLDNGVRLESVEALVTSAAFIQNPSCARQMMTGMRAAIALSRQFQDLAAEWSESPIIRD